MSAPSHETNTLASRARANEGHCLCIDGNAATWIAALAAAFTLLLAATSARGGADTGLPRRLVVAVPDHFPPHYIVRNGGKRTGFAIDVAEAVARRAGIRFKYLPKVDWAQTLDALRMGEADLIPNLGITPARTKDFAFTRPMETIKISVFARTDTQDIHGLEDLASHRVAVIKSNAAQTLLAGQPALGLELVEFDGLSEAILALLSGSVDALAYPEPTVWATAREAGLASRLKVIGNPLQEIKRAMAVRKDRPFLRDHLDRALSTVLSSPEFRSLYVKWYGQTTPWWQRDHLLLTLGGLLLLLIVAILSRHVLALRQNRRLQRELQVKARIAQATGESEQRYRTLVENAPEAVAVLDFGAGHFVDCNDNFLTLFKLEKNGFLQANPLSVSPAKQTDGQPSEQAVAKHLQKAIDGKQSTFEWLSQDTKGRQFPSEIRLVRLPSSDRILIRGSIIDITERKAIEAELTSHRHHLAKLVEERTHELEAANEEMKSFTYIVSHDLRAPLVNIKGFAGELRSGLAALQHLTEPLLPHFDAKQREQYKLLIQNELPEAMMFIESSVTKMDRQLHAVFELSRTGRRELIPMELDTNALVRRILKTIAHQIDETHTKVRVSELPPVVADLTALEQIISNLLDNAVKYLHPKRPGLIEIRAECAPDETRFQVCDNGRGIAERDLEKIFHIFQRVGQQDQPGDGMGLTYVQSLVRRMGGRIWCESVLNQGSCFHFCLPNQTAVILSDEPRVAGLATLKTTGRTYQDGTGPATPRRTPGGA